MKTNSKFLELETEQIIQPKKNINNSRKRLIIVSIAILVLLFVGQNLYASSRTSSHKGMRLNSYNQRNNKPVKYHNNEESCVNFPMNKMVEAADSLIADHISAPLNKEFNNFINACFADKSYLQQREWLFYLDNLARETDSPYGIYDDFQVTFTDELKEGTFSGENAQRCLAGAKTVCTLTSRVDDTTNFLRCDVHSTQIYHKKTYYIVEKVPLDNYENWTNLTVIIFSDLPVATEDEHQWDQKGMISCAFKTQIDKKKCCKTSENWENEVLANKWDLDGDEDNCIFNFGPNGDDLGQLNI